MVTLATGVTLPSADSTTLMSPLAAVATITGIGLPAMAAPRREIRLGGERPSSASGWVLDSPSIWQSIP